MMIEWNNVMSTLGDITKQIKEKTGTDIPSDITEKIIAGSDLIFNPVEALDIEQVKVYNELQTLRKELDELLKLKEKFQAKLNRYKTLERFFTSSIELKHDLVDKPWRVNERTSMVEVFNKEKAQEQMKEMGLNEIIPPGFFDQSNDDD